MGKEFIEALRREEYGDGGTRRKPEIIKREDEDGSGTKKKARRGGNKVPACDGHGT
jgi:hypothetical protein